MATELGVAALAVACLVLVTRVMRVVNELQERVEALEGREQGRAHFSPIRTHFHHLDLDE